MLVKVRVLVRVRTKIGLFGCGFLILPRRGPWQASGLDEAGLRLSFRIWLTRNVNVEAA
jgi:hypothetical protein